MKLQAGQFILPYTVPPGKDQFGCRITWPDGVDKRSLINLIINSYYAHTGRRIDKRTLEQWGMTNALKAIPATRSKRKTKKGSGRPVSSVQAPVPQDT